MLIGNGVLVSGIGLKFVIVEVLDVLQLKGDFSVTKKDSKNDRFTDPKSSKYDFLQGTDLKRGELFRYGAESLEWNLNLVLMFNKMIEKHNINFTLAKET